MQGPTAMTVQPSRAATDTASHASQALGSTSSIPPGQMNHLVDKYERQADIIEQQLQRQAATRRKRMEPAFHPGSVRRAPQQFAPFQVSVLVT